MKKFLLVSFIALSLITSSLPQCMAYQQNNEYIIPQEEFLTLEKQAYDEMVAQYENMDHMRSSSTYEYKYTPVETVITGLSDYKNAAGQPSGGTKWSTVGSGFHWKDSSYSPGSFPMNVSFGNKVVSVGLSYQPGTATNESTSYFTAINSNHVNKYVKLQVARKFSVTHYEIFRKMRTESTWTYIGDEYPSVPYSQAFRISIV